MPREFGLNLCEQGFSETEQWDEPFGCGFLGVERGGIEIPEIKYQDKRLLSNLEPRRDKDCFGFILYIFYLISGHQEPLDHSVIDYFALDHVAKRCHDDMDFLPRVNDRLLSLSE